LSTPNGSFFTTNEPAPYGTYVNGTCVLLSPASSPPSLSVVQPRVTSISALIDPKSSSRGVHQNKIQNHHRFGNYFTTTTPTSLLMNPAQNYRLIINSPTHSLPPENNRVSAIVHSKPQHFNHTDLPVAFKR
jgi:hypothetical protein